jgi:2-polyprenyl-6-methoxyphenol hydroxylase-like FAD-dependent oxidoreductase
VPSSKRVDSSSRADQAPGSEGQASCCIAGCGPAGALAGYLLARAGIDVVVLERHGDFLRDFRGDTIHPSTLEILDQVGLADRFLALPHRKVSTVIGRTASGQEISFSLSRLPTKFPYIAFVPQWDFLEFITREAARFSTFRLVRNADVVGLIEEDGRVCGVRYREGSGERAIRAALTIGADGRSSTTREAARLPGIDTAPAIDVLWFRVSRRLDEAEAVAARLGVGRIVVMLDRGEYWQVAYVIAKGTAERIRSAGLDAFRRDIAEVAPDLADRADELQDWDQIKLLTVKADRLTRWHRPGYLAIGDAAHAMSPIGGVGINIAIHDAVVAANVLWKPLAVGRVAESDLAEVQRRRERAVRVVQAFQAAVQNRVLTPALEGRRAPVIPLVARIVARTPVLRDLPPRLIAFGVSRPRVETPELQSGGR